MMLKSVTFSPVIAARISMIILAGYKGRKEALENQWRKGSENFDTEELSLKSINMEKKGDEDKAN